MKKYAPRKVFILENGEYVEISYEELCCREETDCTYKDKLFLPLYGMIMEVTESTYLEFYKLQRRQKYINERSRDNKDISYDSLTTDEFNGEDILVDDGESVEDQAVRNVTAEEIRFIISLLKPADQELIQAMFFEGLSERQYAERCGVNRNAIHKRKVRILEELKKYLEN